MRFVLALVLATMFGGCVARPYLDLRHPVYLVPRKSFWVGCEKHPLGERVCKLGRVAQVFNGVDEWFRYFRPGHRPKVVMVFSARAVPFYRVNEPIYLAINKIVCGAKIHRACYNYGWDRDTEIVFISADCIGLLMAHEFGHALGREHYEIPMGVYSAMSDDFHGQVTLQDFAIMCRKHRECQIRHIRHKK